MKLTREEIQSLLRLIADTKSDEADCDAMTRVLAKYGEQLVSGETGSDELDAAIQRHLKNCPECREEFDMLRAIVEEGKLGRS
jgi:anti-sigma factor RsiW